MRSFGTRRPDEKTLAAILKAGSFAPSGRNRQSALMVVIEEAADREALRAMNAAILGNPDSDPFYGAPMLILVLADRSVSTCVEDGSLVMGNLMLAAHALGVDSCWIHRAREEFDSAEGKALLKKWGIEGDYIGIGHCLLGYREGEKPAPRPRKAGYVVRPAKR